MRSIAYLVFFLKQESVQESSEASTSRRRVHSETGKSRLLCLAFNTVRSSLRAELKSLTDHGKHLFEREDAAASPCVIWGLASLEASISPWVCCMLVFLEFSAPLPCLPVAICFFFREKPHENPEYGTVLALASASSGLRVFLVHADDLALFVAFFEQLCWQCVGPLKHYSRSTEIFSVCQYLFVENFTHVVWDK